MGSLPFFWATIRAPLHCLGPHEKRVKGYPDAPRTLGEHLRKRRLDFGETQEQTASRFGVTFTSYNGWEADRIAPGIGKWPLILDFLGYDPSPPACATFPEAISALRRRLGLDKHQFAKRVGVDVKSVRNWESGKRVPFRRLRERLAKLGPDLQALVYAERR